MEVIRIRVEMNGDKAALDSLNKIQAKIDQINKSTVKINVDGISGIGTAAAKAQGNVASLSTALTTIGRTATTARGSLVSFSNEMLRMPWNAPAQGAREAAEATGEFAQRSKLLDDVLSRIKFAAIGAAISGVTNAFKNALSEMKAVDSELTNIQKVSGMSATEITKIGDAAYATASKYGVAADEYLSAVYTFQKAGLGDSAEQLGELATKTMLVGDTTATVASKFLIATNAAWDMNGSYAALSTVVDQADYINNNYATSLDKLAAAMPIVASVSANLGMSVEETMAVIGTITSITQETGTKAATAWRALAMNITGELGTITDETGETIEVTTDSVKSMSDALMIYGNDAVKAAKQTGQLVNPMEAVMSLAEAYRDGLLNDIELQNILMGVGGKLRTNQLTALVKDLAGETSIYREMLVGLGEAAGTADAEISVMLSSWDAKAKILSNTWTEFVQKSINSNFIKGILDTATSLLDYLDNLGNAAKTLLGVVLLFKGYSIAQNIVKTVANVRNLMTAFNGAASAATVLGAALSWVGLAVTAFMALKMAVNQYRQAQIEAAEAAAEAATKTADEYESKGEKLAELIAKYKEIAADGISEEERSQVEALERSINSLLGDQFTNVQLVNGAYEQQSGILDENLAIIQQMTAEQRAFALAQQEIALVKTASVGGAISSTGIDRSIFNGLSSFRFEDAYDSFSGSDLGELRFNWGKTGAEIVATYDDITAAIERMVSSYSASELADNSLYAWLLQQQSGMTDAVESYRALLNSGDIEGAENALTEGMDSIGESAETAAERVDDAVNRITAAKNRLNEALSGPSEDVAFKSISDAVKNFRDMIDAGEVNSRAFWNTAEFLFGPDVIAQYADNAAGLIEMFENSDLEEVFNGENLDEFISRLRGVSDAIAEVKDNEDGTVSFSIKDVEALADAWGMTKDQVLALVEYSEAFGALDFEGSGLVDYLEYLGLEAQNGKFALEEVMGELEAMGYTDAQIQSVVEQLEAMGAIDLSDTSDEIEGTGDAADDAETSIDNAADAADDFDAKSTENIKGQFSGVADTVKAVTESINAASNAVDGFDGKNATATLTTRYVTENVVSNRTTTTTTVARASSGGFAGLLSGLSGRYSEGTGSATGGPALVGDEMSTDGRPMPELIYDRGQAYVAGVYGPEIVRLNPGATVFTASETRDILSGNIPAFAFGTAVKSVSSIVNTATTSSAAKAAASNAKTQTKAVTRTITYAQNGGKGGPGKQTFTLGSTVKLSTVRPTRSGYVFLGWARNSAASKPEFSAGGTAKFTANITLYAVWQKVAATTKTSGVSGSYSGAGTTTTTTTSSGGGGGGYSSGGGGGGGGSSSSRSEDPRDTLMQKIQDELTDVEYKIWEGQKSGSMSSPQAIAAYKSAMDKINGYIAQYQKMGEDSNSDYIQKLKKQWWDYADEIEDIQDDLIGELKDVIKEQLSEAEKVKNERIQAIQDAVDAEEELNALEEKRLTLLEAQDALLKAQSERTVRIYNAATGQWEWVADAATVKSAQKAVEDAQKNLNDEISSQSREAQIAAIEAEYEALEDEWEKVLSGLETPNRSLSAIISDINAGGTAAEKTAASGASTLSGSIATAIANMNSAGTVSSVNGKSVMYGASPTTTGSVITGGSSTTGSGGVSYYINGVEISGDRAESMTIVDLARSLSTLAIYNNS